MNLPLAIALASGAGTFSQSALSPAGAHAARIARLWHFFFWTTAAVYLLVMIALLMALMRRRSTQLITEYPRKTFQVVLIATVASVVTLFFLLVSSILTGRQIAEQPGRKVQITITGHQWWWQVDYDNDDPSKRITSANEINIPVGTPVTIRLLSFDVIHSFWAPNLHGKRDLIPGHDGSITIQADRPGVFRGQCAEYCGAQHAKMAFWINARTPDDYARWLASESQPSVTPATDGTRAGQQVFLHSPCPLCHNIQGTEASGSTGPDLTHFAGRRSIGAGALANERDLLAGWILDPQQAKPGCQMPPMLLSRNDLGSLVDYLESLK